MSFQSDIINFSNKSAKEVDRIRRGTIIKLFSQVIDDTPVDTGRLRGNWRTSVNKTLDGTLIQNDKSGLRAKGKILNKLGTFGDSVHMTNNLPYAKVAEYGEWNGPTEKVTSSGFSRKATKGMMRKNALRAKRILRKMARQKQI